jgi:hypothetical protein
MPTAASLAATLIYLVPVVVMLTCRARRERPLWAVALDVPLAVACDLLLVLSLTRFVTLEVAAWASRALWIAGGIACFALRRPAIPRALGRPALAGAALAGAVATLLSTLASRPYSIWDRKQHTPLTASLRGQRLPFDNVFARQEVLHYHFSGDVVGAMVQAFSFDVVHSSLALSVAHDVLFGLIGVTFALLLAGHDGGDPQTAGHDGGYPQTPGLGARRATLAVVATLAALLAGPYTIYRNPAQPHSDGYSVAGFFTLSFRPPIPLAALFCLGIVGALAARVWHDEPERVQLGDTVPALLLSAAGLAISDETSLGLLGLSLGLLWLAYPSVLHPRRAGGVLVLLGLLVAFVGPNVAFAASLAPGAQRHVIALVPWRSPGWHTSPVPLATLNGAGLLLADLGPTTLLCLGGVLGAVAARSKRTVSLATLATWLFLLSVFGLTRLDVNHDPTESHRFAAGLIFLAPVLSVLTLLPHGGAPPQAPRLRTAGIALAAAGALLGSASTIDWILNVLPVRGHRQDHFFTRDDLYAIDCRKDFGARLGAQARPEYLSKAIWYAYAGCQPTFAPASHDNKEWALTIGNPLFEKAAVRALHASEQRPDELLTVVCPREPAASRDPVCAYATHSANCHEVGTQATACELSPEQEAAVMR